MGVSYDAVAEGLPENLKMYGTVDEFNHNEVLCDVILQTNTTEFSLPMRERKSKHVRINEPT